MLNLSMYYKLKLKIRLEGDKSILASSWRKILVTRMEKKRLPYKILYRYKRTLLL